MHNNCALHILKYKGVNNIYIAYFYNDGSSNPSYNDLITYVDKNGNQTSNVFMDTFIFSPASSYKLSSSGKTVASGNFQEADMDKYISDEINYMKALNNKVAEINRRNNSNIKVNAFMTIVLPKGATTSDLVRKFVDKSINEFKKQNFTNINLIGFYWYHESVSTKEVETIIKEYNNYIHKLKYKSLWVPYIDNYRKSTSESYETDLYRKGYSYGFDFVSLQSGYFFSGNDAVWMNYRNNQDRITFTIKEAFSLGMGIEFEIDDSVYMGIGRCERTKEFLSASVEKGWNQNINVYYMPGLLESKESKYARSLYDLIYKYSKGNLTQKDVNNLSCSRNYYDKYTNISIGKKYEIVPIINSQGEVIYTSPHKYADDGIKLTDGLFGETAWSDEKRWVAFPKTVVSKSYHITIDLGKNEGSIGYFALELNNVNSGGIGLPINPIKVYVSKDQKEYKYVGDLVPNDTSDKYYLATYYDLKLSETVSARYIKFEFDKGSKSFIFVSEAIVGKVTQSNSNTNNNSENTEEPNNNSNNSSGNTEEPNNNSNNSSGNTEEPNNNTNNNPGNTEEPNNNTNNNSENREEANNRTWILFVILVAGLSISINLYLYLKKKSKIIKAN